jgi:hypothetical protein
MDLILLAGILVLSLVIVLVAYRLLKLTLKLAVAFVLNALGGLFILLISNFVLNMGIPYDLPTLLISIIGGVPGAICVDILKMLSITL